MAKIYGEQTSQREFVCRFGIAIIAFVVITVFLTGALFQTIREGYITTQIHATLGAEIRKIPSAGLDDVYHYTKDNDLYVLANVHTPTTITPSRVRTMQEKNI
jgi:hypothetical protein